MICEKCKKEKDIEEHHLLPKYMDNPHGYSWNNQVSRVGLCNECHVKEQGIHNKVLLPILLEFSEIKSKKEYLLWKSISQNKKKLVKDIIVEESVRWLNA